MLRLNLLLLAALIACALALVTSQHQARKLYVELQKEQELAKQIEVEWGQLQLEQSTWATHGAHREARDPGARHARAAGVAHPGGAAGRARRRKP